MLDQVQQRPCISAMLKKPVFQKLLDDIERTLSDKASDKHGTPGEIWKHGSQTVQQKLFEPKFVIEKSEVVPQD